VTDIFFSYSSADRERVRPIRDALVAQGFEVFWDQQVPAGTDWDSWIRQHLTKSKCAMAFWSATSVSSDNVRHEATVAKQQGKLISVLLEPLTAEQFPMGLYAQQATNLSGWSGDYSHDEWRKFRREFEAKLTPPWMRRQLDELEAELVGERGRREGAERRDKILQAQIAKEAQVQQDLKRERDKALDEVAALKATVDELTPGREAERQQQLKSEYKKALDEVAALKAKVDELIRARSDAEAQAVELSQRLSEVKTGQSAVTKAEISRWALPLLGLIAFLLTGLLAVLRFQSEAFLQKWDLDGFDKVVLLAVLGIYVLMGALCIYENKRTNGSGLTLALLGSIAFPLTGLVGVLRFAPEAFLQKWDLDGLDKVVLLVVLAIYAVMGAPSIYGKGYGKQHAAPLE
jgi:TIR domain